MNLRAGASIRPCRFGGAGIAVPASITGERAFFKLPRPENKKAAEMIQRLFNILVPRRGLEPPRCYSLVPETSASTNSATWAFQISLAFYT